MVKYQKEAGAGHFDRSAIIGLLTRFFTSFDPKQFSSVEEQFCHLASLYTDLLLSGRDNSRPGGDAIVGIKPLMTAIEAIQGDAGVYGHKVIGSLHREFAKLCLKAKCYQHSLRVIEHPVIAFSKTTSAMDIVSYFYYRGLLFLGLKRWKDALEQFQHVLSFPADCVHAVHVESYKKLLLLSLIQISEGAPPTVDNTPLLTRNLPKDLSATIRYKLETACPTYQTLYNVFVARTDSQFEELILTREVEFAGDKNLGLLQIIAKAYREPLRLKLIQLSDTYLTLKVADVAEKPENIAAVEGIIFDMITDGLMHAKIDSKQKIISFIESAQDSGDQYLDVVSELEIQNKRIVTLAQEV